MKGREADFAGNGWSMRGRAIVGKVLDVPPHS
jgi:hypothetical protein